jgi:glycosyltransferase involved in cell wall biosynthesis
MRSVQRVAFIGNHLPRRCGIATFTHDIHRAVAAAMPNLKTSVVAMTDPGRSYDYPQAVHFEVHDEKIDDYLQAAKFLNDADIDVVSLQHEYGIFGGEAGGNVVELVTRLKMPLVTTLHTVLSAPTPTQRDVLDQIIDASAKIVVMSTKGHDLLCSVHNVPASRIEVIAHGIPDFPFRETDHAKAKLGFVGKKVILTFGLLSPSKGIETVIDAMPGIIKTCPDAVYVILGATHPNLVRHQGETYRNSLMTRARELGVEDHVIFFNQFVGQQTLLDFISMCDVYVTPYLNENQMTSGTLSYSFGLGKAVVATPYWHAKELLSGGLGIIVPFKDAEAMRVEIAGLLTDDVRRDAMRKRAYAESRSMTWAETAKRYVAVFEASRERAAPVIMLPLDKIATVRPTLGIPEMQVEHLLSLCDDTGTLQHATHSVANRDHGYCIDDNARALLFSVTLPRLDDARLPDIVISRFAAFIQHAWNPKTNRFRNFMSYDRRWLEESGSEDSHGRTLWALAECARRDADPSRRKWAAALFMIALPAVEKFSSPRAWAFVLLGLDAYCTLTGAPPFAGRMRILLADRLLALLVASESRDWVWFEDVLAYDNARLPQALIQTGLTTHTPSYIDAGLRSLRWLMSLQTTSSGQFRPVGTNSFGKIRRHPEAFDQQPIEAAAAISACIAASRAEDCVEWAAGAMRAFGWFLGANDLNAKLIDFDTGSCSDGLHSDRSNENKGAESVLSYLLGLAEIRQFTRATIGRTKSLSGPVRAAGPSIAPRIQPGESLAPISNLESSKLIFAPGSFEGGCQALQTGD